MVVWGLKNGVYGEGSAGLMCCYCSISTIVAVGTLVLRDWIPFLQFSFVS